MHPNVIVHTTISLDTAFTGFAIDLERHYAVLMSFEPDAVLTGSASAAASIDAAPWRFPPEEASDRQRSTLRPADRRPVGVFVDSGGGAERSAAFLQAT